MIIRIKLDTLSSLIYTPPAEASYIQLHRKESIYLPLNCSLRNLVILMGTVSLTGGIKLIKKQDHFQIIN